MIYYIDNMIIKHYSFIIYFLFTMKLYEYSILLIHEIHLIILNVKYKNIFLLQ